MKAKYLALFGTALILTATSSVAIAQDNSKPADVQLTPAAMDLLCKEFPLKFSLRQKQQSFT